MTWWLFQHSRLGQEKAALAELERGADWLSVGSWQANNNLEMFVDFSITCGDKLFAFHLKYPSIFPDAPPMVFTKDGSLISRHQYGGEGELCLEHRPDNWDPSVTGADMVASCHRLITEEHPTAGVVVHARSAHTPSLGRDLRSQSFRFLMSEGDLQAVNFLPELEENIFNYSERKTANTYVASLTSIGPIDQAIWVSDLILPEGFTTETGVVVRVPKTGVLNAVTASNLGDFLNEQGLNELKARVLESDTYTNLLLADGENCRLFSIFGKIDDRKVLPYKTVIAPTAQQRLPEAFNVLSDMTIGIVGCGSVGSKIAATLCRTGVSKFLLIDEDIFFPGNVVRNELDLSTVGAHKAVGLRERLKKLAPNISVREYRMTLGGQESSASMVGAIEALGDCDLIVDASGSATAFNMISSIAVRKVKPMVWAQVFAGGIGGLIGRARPNVDPVPLLARGQIDRWCDEQGVEWVKPDAPAPYAGQDADGVPMVADDAEVNIIAAHASRFVIDILARPEASIFPYSAYLIGLSSQWLFEQPFDTRPIDLFPEGEWGERLEQLDQDTFVAILKAHLPPRERDDAATVTD